MQILEIAKEAHQSSARHASADGPARLRRGTLPVLAGDAFGMVQPISAETSSKALEFSVSVERVPDRRGTSRAPACADNRSVRAGAPSLFLLVYAQHTGAYQRSS